MLSCGLVSSELPRELLQAAPLPEVLIQFCAWPWKLGFSSAPQIILMCRQGGSVKMKVPVATARDFDSVSPGLGHESWWLKFLRASKLKSGLEDTVLATMFLYFQLSGFCFPGVPDANQGLVTKADFWAPSLSQFPDPDSGGCRYNRCSMWFLSGHCRKHPVTNRDLEVKGLKRGLSLCWAV